MHIKKLTPNLLVADVNRTVKYYCDNLGAKLLMSVPETGNYDWAMIKLGDVELQFQSEESIKAEYPELQSCTAGGGLTLYIDVVNISAMHLRIFNHQEEVKIIKQINKTFYGATEFAIQDINGYILTFSER